ncbi:MAG: HlyD family type I secretion periplasmic adaptor subunit [Geobacter sp.]
MSVRYRLQAYKELLARYTAIFSHHWRNRHQVNSGLLNETEATFLPAALSLQERPVSPAFRLTARLLMTLVAVLIIWSIVGKIDIIVNASGKIIPSVRTKTIASVDVASVAALHVTEGQAVKAGDILIELDTSVSDAERDKAAGERSMAQLQVARSKALIAAIDTNHSPRLPNVPGVQAEKWEAEQRHLEGQYRDFVAKLKRINGDIDRYAQELPLATQRARDYKELLNNRDVSQHAWLEKEQMRLDLEGRLADARNQRAALIAETKRMAHEAVIEGIRLASASHQDAIKSAAHSRLLRLVAPVDGTVQQLAVHTVGGVVPAAQPLMQIVPGEQAVEIEAFMENKDVGFVQEGQQAAVKIDAFEYTKYGTIPGTVTHVSRDAIQDEKKGLLYSTKITLAKSSMQVNGRSVALSAGMAVNVEIKTGDRRIIEYVLSPVLRHKRESLNER